MSNTKRYKSIYGSPRLLDIDQHLAELVIKRRADKRGIALPHRFWSKKADGYDKTWGNALVGEIIHSRAFSSKYDDDCLLMAFNSKECEVVLTLKNSKFERIAKELQQSKDMLIAVADKVELDIVEANTGPRKIQGKKTKLSRLK